jgi:hypothetical protein
MIAAFYDDQKLIHNDVFFVSNAILSIGWSKLGQGTEIFLEIPSVRHPENYRNLLSLIALYEKKGIYQTFFRYDGWNNPDTPGGFRTRQ